MDEMLSRLRTVLGKKQMRRQRPARSQREIKIASEAVGKNAMPREYRVVVGMNEAEVVELSLTSSARRGMSPVSEPDDFGAG